MKKSTKEQSIIMVNDNLRAVPSYDLLPNMHIHWYEPGDEKFWIAIHTLADKYNKITSELFFEQFASTDLDLTKRQCYLLDNVGHPIATATAWEEHQGQFAQFGQLHWVAVTPRLQNKGIGKMIVSIACQQLITLGYTRAFLETSNLRPAAIHLYEKFGFKIKDDEQVIKQGN